MLVNVSSNDFTSIIRKQEFIRKCSLLVNLVIRMTMISDFADKNLHCALGFIMSHFHLRYVLLFSISYPVDRSSNLWQHTNRLVCKLGIFIKCLLHIFIFVYLALSWLQPRFYLIRIYIYSGRFPIHSTLQHTYTHYILLLLNVESSNRRAFNYFIKVSKFPRNSVSLR